MIARRLTPSGGALAVLGVMLLVGCGEDGGQKTPASAATQNTEADATRQRSEQDEDGAREPTEPAPGGEASIEDFGVEAAGSERTAILASFQRYLNAVAARDHSTACRTLASTVRRSLEQFVSERLKAGGCPTILPKLLAPTAAAIAREQANGKVTKVRVEGDRAFVVFKAPGAELYQLIMVREGGEWRAALVAASVLVPDL